MKLLLASFAMLALLGGCGGHPIAFPTPDSEMSPRPGLFSGDSGAWTLYRK